MVFELIQTGLILPVDSDSVEWPLEILLEMSKHVAHVRFLLGPIGIDAWIQSV